MTIVATLAVAVIAGAIVSRSRAVFVRAMACWAATVLVTVAAGTSLGPWNSAALAQLAAPPVLVWSLALAFHLFPPQLLLATGQSPRDAVDVAFAALAVLGSLVAPHALGFAAVGPSALLPLAACTLCTALWMVWTRWSDSRCVPRLTPDRWSPLDGVVAWSARHPAMATCAFVALAALPLLRGATVILRHHALLGVLAALAVFGGLAALALYASVRRAALALTTPLASALCALAAAPNAASVASVALVFGLALGVSLVTWRALTPPFGRWNAGMRAELAGASACFVPALGAAGVLACTWSQPLSSPWFSAGVGLLVAAAGHALLVPNLHRANAPQPWPDPPAPGSSAHQTLTLRRFSDLRPCLRYWATGKLRLDPMFQQLDRFLPHEGRVLDLGCGFGLVAAWAVMAHPNLQVVCVDPLLSRVRVARHVLAGRGSTHVGEAQELLGRRMPAWAADPMDVALCMDVTHQGSGLAPVLKGLRRVLREGGILLLRTTTKEADQREPWSMRLERMMVRARRQRVAPFPSRETVTAALLAEGFSEVRVADRVRSEAEVLFIARATATRSAG